MNPIKQLFNFLIYDTKEDIKTLKKMFTQEGYIKERIDYIVNGIKVLTFKDIALFLLPLLLFMAASFFVGWFYAAKYYQGLSNQYLVDYCSHNIANNIGASIPNFSIGNLTMGN